MAIECTRDEWRVSSSLERGKFASLSGLVCDQGLLSPTMMRDDYPRDVIRSTPAYLFDEKGRQALMSKSDGFDERLCVLPSLGSDSCEHLMNASKLLPASHPSTFVLRTYSKCTLQWDPLVAMHESTRAVAAHRFLPRVWVGNPRTPDAAVGRTLPNFGFSSFHVSMCNLSFSSCPRRKRRFDALCERELHTQCKL
jgi:hypothetical protein